MSDRDARTIVAARIPVLVLHGRHDIVAAPRHGEALARRSGCLSDMLKALQGAGMRITGHVAVLVLHGRHNIVVAIWLRQGAGAPVLTYL